jgi:hypothetical protein
MNLSVKVATQGPLFTRAAADKMVKAVNSATRELVQKGEQRLAEQLRPRPAGVYLSVAQAQSGMTRAGKPYSNASVGHYRRNISTEFKNMSAIIYDGNVVYGPWLEGIGSRNATSRFKGYGVYRQTASYLGKISRGIYDAHVRHWAKRMNA